MNPDFIKELYYRDILDGRRVDYLKRAEEIAKEYNISDLSSSQIKGLENIAFSAKNNITPILTFLDERCKKSSPGQDWLRKSNSKTLSEAISDFIKNQICTDGGGMKSIKEDCIEMSDDDLKTLVEYTQLKLTREFIKYLSGYYRIKTA